MRVIVSGLMLAAALFCMAGCALDRPLRLSPLGASVPKEMPAQAQAYSHYLAATLHERSGQFEQAMTELQKAAELDSQSLPLLMKIARGYLRLQDFEHAREVCRRATELAPEDATLWVVLGGIEQHLKNYDGAAEAFQRAITINPDSALGYEALILAEESTNDLIAAIDMYQKLIELSPNSPYAAALHFRLGLNLARTNDAAGAAQAMEKAVAINPDLPGLRYFLGLVYMGMDKNAEAAEQFRKAVEADGQDPSVRENLAGVLAQMGDYTGAIEALNGLVKANPAAVEPRHQFELVYLYLRAGRPEEARPLVPANDAPLFATLFRALIRRDLGEAYQPLIKSLDEIEGDVDMECEAFLAHLLSLFGEKDAGPYLKTAMQTLRDAGATSRTLDQILARALMALEENEQAAQVLLDTLKAHGPDKWTHYYLASVYETLDRFAEAEAHLQACLKLDPNDAEVMNFLGYLYADKNVKLGEAEALLNRALELEPDNAFYLDSLGWVYYRKGDGARAVELIRRAILTMDTDDAVLRDHLGDAYLLNGDVAKALSEWERAIRLDPELDGVKDKIEKHRQ